jgi:hypothetical protein
MAEQHSFPFASNGTDNLYASEDFRKVLRHLIGDGRCELPASDGVGFISVANSLQGKITSNPTPNNSDQFIITSGACMVGGGFYQLKGDLTIGFEYSAQNLTNCMVAAVMDPLTARKIELKALKTAPVGLEYFVLATFDSTTSVRVQNLKNTTGVAYLKNIANDIQAIKYYNSEQEALQAGSNILALYPL